MTRPLSAESRRSSFGQGTRRQEGFSIEQFVGKLGITRAAFHKQITRKAIPSLRVLANARRYWGVQLSYGELGDTYLRAKKKDPRQTEFQFSVEDISRDQIEIRRVSAKGEKAVEVLIKIDFSKTA